MDSLVQQRLALERERTIGWVMLALGLCFAAGSVWIAVSGNAWSWLSVAVWVVWVIVAARRVLRARRTLHRFEQEHGVTVGVRQ